jgi:protein-tyrosine-phosphatase
MLVLGLQGSPRLKGNAKCLLTAFMGEVEKLGFHTQTIDVCQKNIKPCEEYIVCEKKGFCPIKDDMRDEIFSLIREADVLVMATPVFFFNTTAQMKALIDRCQTFWALKYRFKYKERLFEGLELTTKYFFDAIDARFAGSLTYPKIEHVGDMEKLPSFKDDVQKAVRSLLKPYADRKKILIVGRENTCRTQMAHAFAQDLAGQRLEIEAGGLQPATKIDPQTVKVMREKGLDIAFLKPKTIEQALTGPEPDLAITFDSEEIDGLGPHTPVERWSLSKVSDGSLESLRALRDNIETRVTKLLNTI